MLPHYIPSTPEILLVFNVISSKLKYKYVCTIHENSIIITSLANSVTEIKENIVFFFKFVFSYDQHQLRCDYLKTIVTCIQVYWVHL